MPGLASLENALRHLKSRVAAQGSFDCAQDDRFVLITGWLGYCFFSILAQVSFRATVRLKTGLAGVVSGSAQKYPRRSNW